MNTHDEIRGELAAFLSGDLGDDRAAPLRTHLDACDDCRRELDSLRLLWNALGAIPEERPSPALAARFRAALDAPAPGTPGPFPRRPPRRTTLLDRLFPPRPALQFALMLAVAVAGGILGYSLRSNGARTDEIGQLREEVRSVSRLLIVSLLQQQSAAERLRGVRWSTTIDHPDPEITTALLGTLAHDPNVNVRLAALDALAENVARPEVRDQVLDALGRESSPMLQLAIIDLAVRSDLRESGEVFRRILREPGVNEAVKKRIQDALQDMNI